MNRFSEMNSPMLPRNESKPLNMTIKYENIQYFLACLLYGFSMVVWNIESKEAL